MTYIDDTAYLNVRRFHFILFIIKMYDGDVEIFDSRTKEPILYKSAFDILK
jgi:hypothetical protein